MNKESWCNGKNEEKQPKALNYKQPRQQHIQDVFGSTFQRLLNSSMLTSATVVGFNFICHKTGLNKNYKYCAKQDEYVN